MIDCWGDVEPHLEINMPQPELIFLLVTPSVQLPKLNACKKLCIPPSSLPVLTLLLSLVTCQFFNILNAHFLLSINFQHCLSKGSTYLPLYSAVTTLLSTYHCAPNISSILCLVLIVKPRKSSHVFATLNVFNASPSSRAVLLKVCHHQNHGIRNTGDRSGIFSFINTPGNVIIHNTLWRTLPRRKATHPFAGHLLPFIIWFKSFISQISFITCSSTTEMICKPLEVVFAHKFIPLHKLILHLVFISMSISWQCLLNLQVQLFSTGEWFWTSMTSGLEAANI